MYFGGGFLFSLPEPLILLITLIFHTHGNQSESFISVHPDDLQVNGNAFES